VSESPTNRFNVLLDDEHAAKLHRLAERTYVNPGTIARSLLSRALDQADPSPEHVAALLDAMPGAHESALEGRTDIEAGRLTKLEDL
jgi:predicted transcriptional regulator